MATGIKSLAARNLLRGSAMGLPSGQDVAAAMGIQPLADAELELEGRPAPLWYYVLKEAELGGGKRLGPVGGHIVAEVFVGLLAHDPSSWLHSRPTWKPFLGRHGGTFTMADLIKFTGYGLEVIVLAPAGARSHDLTRRRAIARHGQDSDHQLGDRVVTTFVQGPSGTSSAATNRQLTVPDPASLRARASSCDRSMPARSPNVFLGLTRIGSAGSWPDGPKT